GFDGHLAPLRDRSCESGKEDHHTEAPREFDQLPALSAGVASPATKPVWRLISGAQRLRCEQPQGKTPLSVQHLRLICENMTKAQSAIAIRNQAVLVFGFT